MFLVVADGRWHYSCKRQLGRTPVVVGKKEGAYAVTGESTAFPNLDYETVYYLGPGEIVRLQAEGMECLRRPHKRMQVCSFLWVYYGFPTSCYEGKNVEEFRFACGKKMGERTRPKWIVPVAYRIPVSAWLWGMRQERECPTNVPFPSTLLHGPGASLRAIRRCVPWWPR